MTAEPTYEYAVAWVRPDTGEEGRVVCESKRQARRWASGLNWWSGQNGGPKYRIQRGRIVWEDVPDGD